MSNHSKETPSEASLGDTRPSIPAIEATNETEEARFEREKQEQAVEKARCRERFGKKFFEKEGFPERARATLEQLSSEELLFMRGYIDGHAGEWDLFDGKNILVTGLRLTEQGLIVTFLICGETEDDDTPLDQLIPRGPEMEERLKEEGKIRSRRGPNAC